MKINKAKAPENMLPNGTTAEEAVNILAEHFLGKIVIDGYPATQEQWNTEVVAEILRIYPRGSIRKIKQRYFYDLK
jgi:hypothetical protein